MAADLICVEWHLTPRGWIKGNWSINKPLMLESSPPNDGVETWLETQIIPDSDYSRMQHLWSLSWASPELSEKDRKTLRAAIRNPAPESEQASSLLEFPTEELRSELRRL